MPLPELLVNGQECGYSTRMGRKNLLIVSLILAVLVTTSSSCVFGPTNLRGIMSYRHGRVYLKRNDYYKVGILPNGWKRAKTHVRTITFYNAELKSSISTDAFCGRMMEDGTLSVLGSDMISDLEHKNIISKKNIKLDRRGAIRRVVSGSLDGVDVSVDLVSTRKNGCVFDFYSVAPLNGADLSSVASAFKTFFMGFHY